MLIGKIIEDVAACSSRVHAIYATSAVMTVIAHLGTDSQRVDK